ncbi:MAG TPA: hypothetical protein VKB04_11960, partial [Anaerolineales bacterium]|nr:hypothetical protein [Anaerolineales bacterium]
KAGQVGQEVYGAGLPFGMVPRHYWQVPDEKFMIYVEYPVKDFSAEEDGKASFHILGDRRLFCRLRIIPTGKNALPEFELSAEGEDGTEMIEGSETPEGHMEYILSGDQEVTIQWDVNGSKTLDQKESKNGRKGTKK